MSDDDWNSLLFYVDFKGEELNRHGAGIYDLGTALLSMQRMVHKAHLAYENRLIKKAYPRKGAIKDLALQLGGRYKGSDIYGLVPIITSPANIDHLKLLAGMVMKALVPYYTKKVIDSFSKEPDQKQQALIGSIHAEVVNVVGRVDTQAGLETLSIGSPVISSSNRVIFDSGTRDYLNEISDERLLGAEQEIFARPYKLYPNSDIVGVRLLGKGTCSIYLSPENFEKIRYDRERNAVWCFVGRPRYGLGATFDQITEFEAREIKKVRETD